MIRIHKTHCDFYGFLFVAAAVAKNHTTPALNLIHSTGQMIEATDGHRAHRFNLSEEIPAGLYGVVSKSKKEIVLVEDKDNHQYPDINRVIPLNPELSTLPVSKCFERIYCEVIRALPSGYAVQIDFFKDALSGNPTEFSAGGGKGPIYLKGEKSLAIIMLMECI